MSDIEVGVLERYSAGAANREAELCCPVDYDRELLKLLPTEIIEKDYGCGDPSRYVRAGDTVLDLGSGAGKICYMAAQLVGDTGKVIGVDMNDDMLALSRKYQAEMATKLGSERVEFVKAQIQDLALDLTSVDAYLCTNPITTFPEILQLRTWQQQQRQQQPLIADNSIDLVISNCVLNLINDADKTQMLQEIFRVTKAGGRIAISDIVSDEPVPDALKQDQKLWSGCISGAMQEQALLQAFVDAGFVAVSYDKWESEPWQIVAGIEFRAVTITAVKPEATACIDKGHAVVYRGKYAQVSDDEGHVYYRGQRMAVCERNFKLLTSSVYAGDFIGIPPNTISAGTAWECKTDSIRPVALSKGSAHQTVDLNACC